MRKLIPVAGLAAILCLCGAAFANETGEVILVGSDAVSFHSDSTFGGQLVSSHLGGSIAYINDFGGGTSALAGASVTSFSSLGAAETFGLGSFSGVFIASPHRCCTDPMGDASLGLTPGNLATLAGYVSGGGDVAIEDFQALSGWTPLLGFDPTGGLVSNHLPGDPPVDFAHPTAEGISEGFTGKPAGSFSYSEDAFVHQTYNLGFFAAHGYNSLIDGGTAGGATVSSVLESDGPVGAPEPATLLLLGSGLAGLILKKLKS